jgi:hypothetical protein
VIGLPRMTNTLSCVVVYLSLLCGPVACGGGSDETPERASTAPASIESAQVHGTWIFLNQPELALEARLEGTAQVLDECLRVDEYVVVWQKADAPIVETFVASLAERPSRRVGLGGGGSSIAEGGPFDATLDEVTQRCPTSAIWFSGPLRDGWILE